MNLTPHIAKTKEIINESFSMLRELTPDLSFMSDAVPAQIVLLNNAILANQIVIMEALEEINNKFPRSIMHKGPG
jgi:hypothetical protein